MEMTETQAPEILKFQGDTNASDIQGVQFTQVNDYTTFRAEFAIEEGDFIFHFFLAPEVLARAQELQGDIHKKQLLELEALVKKYWLDSFPRSLDIVARNFFQAGPERLKATYIDDYELKYWWLRCQGYADQGLNPEARCQAFLEKLDQALDAVKLNVRRV